MATKRPTPKAPVKSPVKVAAKTKAVAKPTPLTKAVKPSPKVRKPSNLNGKIASLTKEATPAQVANHIRTEAKKVAGGGSPPKGGVKEEKRSVGRPTKYKPEFAQQLVDYFDKGKAGYTTVTVANGDGREKLETVPVEFPTFEEFAADIGVSRETLHSWAADKDKDGNPLNPNFSDAYARARTRQTAILVKGGMAGAFESRFAGLAAKNLAGWKDKMEQTVDDVTGFSPAEKAEMERGYEEAKLSGVWVAQKAAMQARKKEMEGEA